MVRGLTKGLSFHYLEQEQRGGGCPEKKKKKKGASVELLST
jgi:hypothetical protein